MTYTPWSVIAGETPTATKWNYLGGNDADFDSRLTQLDEDKTMGSGSDGATVTLDMSAHRLWEVTIAGNRTIAFDNVDGKKPFAVFIRQDGSGNRTPTWPAGVDWGENGTPDYTLTADKADGFLFVPKEDWVESSNEVYYGSVIGYGFS